MLLQNKTIYAQYPVRFSGGATGNERSQFGERSTTNANKYMGYANIPLAVGTPRGYGFHYEYAKRIKIIGAATNNTLYTDISITNGIVGLGLIVTPRIIGSYSIFCAIGGTSFIGVANKVHISAIAKLTSDIVGLATVDASIAALVNMVADLVGTSDISAALGGLSSAICNIIGEANLSGDISGNALLSSDIAGASTLTVDVIASMYITATILAEAVLSGDIDAGAFMSANLYVGAAVDPLSPTSLAAAVWNAVANEFNDSGTMGQKLNSAAVGGVDYDALAIAVWDAEVSGRTGVEAGKVLEDVKKKVNMIPGLY